MNRFVLASTWVLALTAAACVTGPRSRPKSKLNYLNGAHYRGENFVGGIPVTIHRRVVSTTIEGQALVERSQFYQSALKFGELVLLSDGRELARTSTDQDGNYVFREDLKNGTYRIAPADQQYSGEVKVVVDDYEVRNVTLKVKLRDATSAPATGGESRP